MHRSKLKSNVGGNDMKTMMAFTMALTTLVLATAADADAQDRRCQQAGKNGGILARAGTPCVWPLYGLHPTEIIEPPHNGTAVLRSDGSIYYSPKPGFTGRDHMRVRATNGAACQLREVTGSTYFPPCYETPRLGFWVE
jgi:hypothetical protein